MKPAQFASGAGILMVGIMFAALTALAQSPSIIPLPEQMQTSAGAFTLCPPRAPSAAPGHPAVKIFTDAISQPTGEFLAQQLFQSTGWQFLVVTTNSSAAITNAILLTTSGANTNLNSEGYELTVTTNSILIRAPKSAGVFYGVQSLLQLLPPEIFSPLPTNVTWTAPCVYIHDEPRFPWRGVMLDCARHFFSKQDIKRLLDAMATLKLNTFHWHLTDDQAWRLEITNYPALTTNSAWRESMDYSLNMRATSETNAAGQYGGFYTQADAREIVAYARQLHITVVPEIELPSHATAALAAYPQFGCGNPADDYHKDYPNIDYGVDLFSPGSPGTMDFFKEVLSETMAIFPSQYIHCGGDEVVASYDRQWNSYSNDVAQMQALGITPNGTSSIIAYQHWLSTNLAAFVKSKGRTMMGWSEFEAGGVVPDAALMDWETGSSSYAVAAASAGQKVVMSPDTTCYINYLQVTNLDYEPPFIVGYHPAYLSVSNVYDFEPIPSALPAPYDTNILGAQCNLWTEYVPSFRNVMFKIFPRAAATAELTWTPAAQKNYSDFTNRLVPFEQRLAEMQINYNHETIPQIGAWSQAPDSPATWQFDITTNVTAAGEIDVNFAYTGGTNALNISWVSLQRNGTEIDRDTHAGYAQTNRDNSSRPYVRWTTNQTIYILNLPAYQPGATYSIQAAVQGDGGTNSAGNIYLPNWN